MKIRNLVIFSVERNQIRIKVFVKNNVFNNVNNVLISNIVITHLTKKQKCFTELLN